jgi:hypothetical protein
MFRLMGALKFWAIAIAFTGFSVTAYIIWYAYSAGKSARDRLVSEIRSRKRTIKIKDNE